MESVEKIIQILFGGQVDVAKIATIFTVLYGVVMSICEWHAKKKLIASDKQLTSADMKLDAQRQELDEVKKSLTAMASMIATAYLSSNTVDANTKQRIAAFAEQMQKIANIEISKTASELIDAISKNNPNINEIKEEILAETKVAEEIVDTANKATTDLIDQLKL